MNVETTGVTGNPQRRSYVAAAAGMTRGLALVQGANDATLAIASVANAAAFAILEESTVYAGDSLSAIYEGEAVAIIGAAVQAGQNLITNAAGQLVPATGATNQNIVARAVSSGSNAGDYIVVFVTPDTGPTQDAVTHYTVAGAIPVTPGTSGIGSAAALAMTLVQPTANQDGTRVFITAETAHAHTITTAANGINGAKHVVTFAAQGDGVELEAMATVWNVRSLVGTASIT
jgi:hypothetical protein